jgi:hypothetical protein
MTQHAVVEATSVDAPENISDEQLQNYVGISRATQLLEFKYSQYTRRLVLEGKLEAVKVKYGHYNKWMISLDAIDEYMSAHRRTNQLRRYIFKIDQDNEEAVREALDELGIEFELELSYKPDNS